MMTGLCVFAARLLLTTQVSESTTLPVSAPETIPASAPASAPAGAELTFDAAIAAVRERNENAQIADQQLREVVAARDRAWAALLPLLSVRGSYTRNDREIDANNRVLQRQDVIAGTATAALTLFRGPAIPSLLRANSVLDAAEQRTRWTKNDLTFETASAFYAALASDNVAGAASRALRTAEQHLQAARARRAAGGALALDETRAQIEVVAAQGQLVRASNARENAYQYVAFLTAQPSPLLLARPADDPPPPATDPAALRRTLEKRPDLRAAAHDVEAANRAVTSAWMDYLPTLGVAANYQATQNTGWSGDPFSWNVVVTIEWLLFDGGLRRATRHERDAQLVEARLRRRLLERATERAVQQAGRDLATALAARATAEERQRLATQSQRMTLGLYRAGLATSLELSDADDALVQAEIAVAAEQLDVALGRLQLLRAIGLDPLGQPIPPSDHTSGGL